MNGKIALGALGGIGLITTVSVVSSRSGSSDTSWSKGIPLFSFLSSNKAFMNKQQDDRIYRFGYRYAGLLVSDVDSNNDWWEWSYKNLEKDLNSRNKPSEETFKSLNASSTVPNSADSLKTWCSGIYKLNIGSSEPFDSRNSLFINTSIWKYCSPIQKVPISLEQSGANYSANTVGKEMGWTLLALNGNDRIWYYKSKFFDGIKADEFGEEPNLEILKEGRKHDRKIKDICSDVYKKDASEFHPVFFTFCSISSGI